MIQEENLHKDKENENDLPVSLERIREANTTMSLFGLGRQLVSQCKCAASYNRGRPRCDCVKLLEKIVAKDPGVVLSAASGGMRLLSMCTNPSMFKALLVGQRLWHTRVLCRRTVQLVLARYKSVGREGRERLETEAAWLLQVLEGLTAMYGSINAVLHYL